MMSKFIGFKDGKEIEWLELNLLQNNRSISKSEIISVSGYEEQYVDSWLSTLQTREAFYKKPFYEVRQNKLYPLFSWEERPEYFLCLYYSFNGANDYSGGTSLFERISAQALKNFINGEVFTFGFPAGAGFNNNLDRIPNLCFETRNLRAASTYKDDGVDVLGYKLFEDQRSSNLYVLLQCAAGKHWAKKKPINMNNWVNYIIWYPDNIIQSISTVEFVQQDIWDKRTSTFGMLFDRLRIYNFLYEKEIEPILRQEVTDWCDKKISEGI